MLLFFLVGFCRILCREKNQISNVAFGRVHALGRYRGYSSTEPCRFGHTRGTRVPNLVVSVILGVPAYRTWSFRSYPGYPSTELGSVGHTRVGARPGTPRVYFILSGTPPSTPSKSVPFFSCDFRAVDAQNRDVLYV